MRELVEAGIAESEVDFMQVLRSYAKGPIAVTESSLSRIMQRAQEVENQDMASFAVLTSWQYDKTPAENQANWKQFLAKLASLQLGFNKLLGHWMQCKLKDGSGEPIPYHSCPPEEKEHTVEPSVFISGINLAQTSQLARLYNQQGWIYAGPETQSDVELFDKSGRSKVIGPWRAGALAQGYSQLPGKPGLFKSLDIASSSGVASLPKGGRSYTFAKPEDAGSMASPEPFAHRQGFNWERGFIPQEDRQLMMVELEPGTIAELRQREDFRDNRRLCVEEIRRWPFVR